MTVLLEDYPKLKFFFTNFNAEIQLYNLALKICATRRYLAQVTIIWHNFAKSRAPQKVTNNTYKKAAHKMLLKFTSIPLSQSFLLRNPKV